MAVEPSLASLYEKLKVEDPWLPPRPWESIPSESGFSQPRVASSSPSPSENRLFDTSTVSEASLVRLALNALQGLESAVVSIEKLSDVFCSDPADRTCHRINGLWSRSSSTHAVGKILKSIGFSGFMVFLLRKFVRHFMRLSLDGKLCETGHGGTEATGNACPFGLVNQAFSGAVNKILEGYMCALDTLHASVGLRQSSESVPLSLDRPHQIGSLTSVVLSRITLLEIYLHTKEVRSKIEALGSICNLRNVALGFSLASFEGLTAKAVECFAVFPRGSDLLSYLYEQLQVADPAHSALLKYLFVRSCEPYFGFIRSWIFKAEINDPYEEFMVEYVPNSGSHSKGEAGYLPEASVQIRDGVSLPNFLKDFSIPILRAGQQLQVLMKLFEFCNYIAPGINTYDDFLPCWKGFMDPSHTSPLTFSRWSIGRLVLARNNYYIKVQEKLAEISANLEFTYHQGNLDVTASFVLSDCVDCERVDNFNSDGSTATCDGDPFDSYDCLSSDFSDEQIESEELIDLPNGSSHHEDTYLSALKFSRRASEDNSVEKNQLLCHKKISPDETSENTGFYSSAVPSYSADGPFRSNKVHIDRQFRELTQLSSVLPRDNIWLRPSEFGLITRDQETEVPQEMISFRDSGPSRPSPKDVIVPNDELDAAANAPSSLTLQSAGFRGLNFLSRNPMLSIKAFTNSMSKPGSHCCNVYGNSLPCFEFSTIEDAIRVYAGKLDGGSRELQYETSSRKISDKALIENTEAAAAHSAMGRKEQNKEVSMSTNISGGGGWESLLGSLRDPAQKNVNRQQETSPDSFEMPLDFIVEKCILQEIWLQYKYVSKLTIKLLEDGFDLQEHLLTLRRYHFMGVADWVDLFIMSIWHHKSKGFVTEGEQRASDIQGLLETSIQRSSCESDKYKDRLFVYFEEHDVMLQSTSATGIHSFDFLHLGYRVNWPISIILTPSALKIYAEIFNFLIKVKLASFSLTDSWCLLKDSMHSADQNTRQQVKEANQINAFINMRHQLNHFISMLQQYVQSQLSHVSWCRFLHSLKQKVKDMMDLESVHMEYLTDSLHICFLSEETQAIGSIIKNVLQHALEFRGCLVRGVHGTTGSQADLLEKVRVIKLKFDQSMEELQRIYIRSPKHGKFGISHFWSFLNYNEYYSSRSNQNTFFF